MMSSRDVNVPRSVRESQVVMNQAMLPGDANPFGNVHGGVIMKLVDTAAGVSATRHVRGRVVTARLDSMSFLEPVYVGDLVTLKASVNDVGKTSLEVGVRVEAENLITGVVRHVSSAYLVMVALDDQGKPTPVPPLIAETETERRRMAEAQVRRDHRQRGDQAIRAMRGQRDLRSTLASWRQAGESAVVVGHRGAAGVAPENTMPSFELAWSLGADAIEIDVHLSRDGALVVMHDATVDRTTNGHGKISELSLAELQTLDASGKTNNSNRPARVPTLDEVLAWARGKTHLVIELKGTEHPNLVAQTIQAVREYRMLDQVMLISFDHQALREARLLSSDVWTGCLYVGRVADPVGLARSCDADALCPNFGLVQPDDVAVAHDAGLAVCVWTVNEPTAIQSAHRLGVDSITSDFPDRLRLNDSPDR